MTQYASSPIAGSADRKRVQEAKAKRQAVLARVRKQRAAAHKRTVHEWMQEGFIIRASELKERYSVKGTATSHSTTTSGR